MYIADHPPPHFHVWYGGRKARVSIVSGDVLDGEMPPRVRRMLREWTDLRRAELEANWSRAAAELPLVPVEPLP